MTALRIAIAGAAGRMGRELVRAVLADPDCALAAAFETSSNPHLGADAAVLAGLPASGLVISGDAQEALGAADALIDFTAPASSVALAAKSAALGIVHVIGTTGLSSTEESQIAEAAQRTVIIHSGNMSMGVNVLAALAAQTARALPEFDVSILEMHHRAKKDAPSGTAFLLGRAIADARDYEPTAWRKPSGAPGPRPNEMIEMASLRGGTVVGEHQVIFAGPCERVVLTHIAEDRAIFARGALIAAKWGRSSTPGLYSMADVLGLSS